MSLKLVKDGATLEICGLLCFFNKWDNDDNIFFKKNSKLPRCINVFAQRYKIKSKKRFFYGQNYSNLEVIKIDEKHYPR